MAPVSEPLTASSPAFILELLRYTSCYTDQDICIDGTLFPKNNLLR